MKRLLYVFALFAAVDVVAQNSFIDQPYLMSKLIESRSISFENPTGEPGKGGMTASPIGVGRKGSPAKMIEDKETVVLADVKGNGTIRHIWTTTIGNPMVLRGCIIRIYWDGQEHPSIEAPWGDFFGFAHGYTPAFESAVHSIGQSAGMNFWLPMPFTTSAKITLTNECGFPIPLFYQIDYTINETHPKDVGRMHVLFKRENKTTAEKDFELLPKRTGKGRYIGSVMGIRVEDAKWWGEGEFKVFKDGDTEFPTICGTGAEDYVGLSWGMQQTPFRYHGCNLKDNGFVSMYRWHLPDPIYWNTEARITIQQIGHKGESMLPSDYMNQLENRQDDWSAATFWYEPIPSAPLPALVPVEERIKDLYKAKK